MHRLARERFEPLPLASEVRWTLGKGVIGVCWQSGREQVVQTEKIDQRWGGCTEEQWRNARADTRMGLPYDDYMKIANKYGTVVAVPIKDRKEHVIGVVTLDGPPGNHAALSRREVVRDVANAALMVALILGRG